LAKKNIKHIVFDHDGTLVDTSSFNRGVYPGIKDLLSYLSTRGINLYVWTARDRRSTVEILDSLDIIGQFKEMSCGSEALQKPSPEGISNMLRDIEPESVAVIGDSLGDVVGGSEFGALTFGAMWGHPSSSASSLMLDNGADFVCASVNDFKKIIEEYI
jgi:phosphoglycolate phosphatase